ncbi:MAG: 50S ribosomal protein L31 [Parcubacteria group bacterium RIFOXYD2_FULL_52_8]|nr:MAG: 50S ribosomal protein L31 [Parcubacteria group bacterium RIFOXYD2_FULL_52_8]
MKAKIHPTYYPTAQVTCSCGAAFTVGSTKASFQVEICSQCHPFYTGNEKVIDTAGRVEKFNRKRAAAQPKKPAKKAKAAPAAEAEEAVAAEAAPAEETQA